jgi:hypothetical protein
LTEEELEVYNLQQHQFMLINNQIDLGGLRELEQELKIEDFIGLIDLFIAYKKYSIAQ